MEKIDKRHHTVKIKAHFCIFVVITQLWKDFCLFVLEIVYPTR